MVDHQPSTENNRIISSKLHLICETVDDRPLLKLTLFILFCVFVYML